MDGTRSAPRRAATVKDVARAAGVSIASVSRVINGTGPVAQATRQRVTDAIARLRYVPHGGAASLVKRRHGVVGLLLPALPAEPFAELVRGIEETARRQGRLLLVARIPDDDGESLRTVAGLKGHVDGLLCMAPHLDTGALARLLPEDLPTVLMGTHATADQGACVIDNRGAVLELMGHLKHTGRRVVAHIAGPAGNHDAGEREHAWREALARYWPGVEAPLFRGDFEEASGYAAGCAIARLETRPDAVFAANDTMAAGAMRALLEAGLSVPGDVAIAGFDDIPLASLLRPALTSVHVDVAELGRRALARLLEVIEQPELSRERIEPVRPTLVVRASTGAAGAPTDSRV